MNGLRRYRLPAPLHEWFSLRLLLSGGWGAAATSGSSRGRPTLSSRPADNFGQAAEQGPDLPEQSGGRACDACTQCLFSSNPPGFAETFAFLSPGQGRSRQRPSLICWRVGTGQHADGVRPGPLPADGPASRQRMSSMSERELPMDPAWPPAGRKPGRPKALPALNSARCVAAQGPSQESWSCRSRVLNASACCA